MLAIDEHLFEIDEAIDEVAKAFLALDAVQVYLEIKKIFLADTVLQESISEFQDLKQSYEEVKDYAAFRSEVKEIRRQLLQKKRELDLNRTVSVLRQNEVAVQTILAELTQEISSVISPTIFVDTGLPLAPHKSHIRIVVREEREMFKKQERQGIIVYLYYNRDARKLNKYGDVLYHSRKLHYQVLYVNKEEEADIVEEISALKFVKAVSLSEIDNIDQDFVGNLAHF